MKDSRIEKHLSKQELVNLIAQIALDGNEYVLSNGSSIPSKFFIDLEERFSVPSSSGMESKAATFCDYFSIPWTSDCDSSETPSGGGGTVTRIGLERILEAVNKALTNTD